MVKPKISLVFTHRPRGESTWPHAEYDYEKRTNELIQKLNVSCPDIDFYPTVIHNREQAENLVKQSTKFDGFLVYIVGLWTGAPGTIARSGKPTVLVDDLYAGSGEFLLAFPSARRDGFPVVGVTSSDFEDVVEAVKLFEVKKRISEAKILVLTKRDVGAQVARIREIFGTEVIEMSAEELNNYYASISEEEAKVWADKWTSEALRVVEPTYDEIVKSAKMYLALKKAIEERGADAVTVDCLLLFNEGKLPAYPCLSHFQMNNEGLTGVCEADLNSTVTQLLMRYLTNRSGYVSDPVIDLATGQIIYAHCVATNRVFGPGGFENPYTIRSHAEDRKGASVQSLMPLGEKITTVQMDVMSKIMTIHQGRAVANIEEEKACRTKLAVEADVERILTNWNRKGDWRRYHGWHRVTFYGDWRKQLINLGALMGIEVFEEDRV